MTETSVYAPSVDTEGLAKQLAIGYVGSRLDDTLTQVANAPQIRTYVSALGASSPTIIGEYGRGIYQPPSPTLKTDPSRFGGGRVRQLLRMLRQQDKHQVRQKTLHRAWSSKPLSAAGTKQVFFQASARSALGQPSYEPIEKWQVILTRVSKPTVEPNAGALLRSIAASITDVQRKAIEVIEAIEISDRYVDDGLAHPAPDFVQTIRVRLRPAGPAAPRIAYDPDRE